MNKKELSEILIKAIKSLKTAPEGYIRLSNSNNTIQYYNVRKYIPKSNVELITKLAQKRYDTEVVSIVSKELKKEKYDTKCIEKVLDTLPQAIKCFITPYAISDEEYAKQWKEIKYKSKEKDGTYITANGEHVRSKSEVMIADRLLLNNIPYRYEETVQLKANYKHLEYHPDFTVLNKRTRQEYLIEHFGKMDNFDYANKAMRKINNYAANGYIQGKNILFTFETSLYPLDMNTVDALIKTYLI